MANAKQPYQIYLYNSHKREHVTYNTPNEKFGNLLYFYKFHTPVFDIFKSLIIKQHMSFTHWGVTKNGYVFVLVQSLTDDPRNVYVIYNNSKPLTENALIEISDYIEYDVSVSHHPMYDLRLE